MHHFSFLIPTLAKVREGVRSFGWAQSITKLLSSDGELQLQTLRFISNVAIDRMFIAVCFIFALNPLTHDCFSSILQKALT